MARRQGLIVGACAFAPGRRSQLAMLAVSKALTTPPENKRIPAIHSDTLSARRCLMTDSLTGGGGRCS
jgi:hypothetical protein